MLDWQSETWEGSKYNNGRLIPNRPLNTEPVSHVLAQKIHQALYNNFDGLETAIRYAGTEGDTNHRYWVLLPKVLATTRMNELRTFVRGFIACYTSY